jgi:trimeric autotransporter adhesin
MANTLIQLKHSTVTNIPPALNIAEPAYSYTSNTLFIGTPGSNGTINIGGYLYTKTIDDATDSATGGTLVKRDATGNASFNYITANVINATIDGNANSATQLQTPRWFNLSGDIDPVSVSFNGTANADFTLELTNTGVTSGTYGGQTKIPTFTVDVDGRITSAANVDVATTLSLSADGATTTSIDLLSETLSLVGGDGITTTANATTNSVRFDVDNTVIRTTGNQSITGDFTLNGNLIVQGNTVSYNVTSYVVDDPIILIANNNTGNSLDLGFVAHYEDGGDTKHTGLVRNVATGTWYLFENYGPHIQEDHVLNIADPTLVVSNLYSNLIGGRVYDLASAIEVSDGGTGRNTFTTGSIVIGNGTGGLLELANTSSTGTYANASHVPVITVDAYGRVSGVVNTKIDIDTSQVTTGILPIARGGTNNDTFTTGSLVYHDGTKLASIANTTYVQTGTLTTSNTVTSVSVDSYGRLTALTTQAIVLDTSQITTGILPVVRGGTGANTFTTNGVLLGQGTNPVSTVSSSTEGHVLTINGFGVPTFSMLSGGTF